MCSKLLRMEKLPLRHYSFFILMKSLEVLIEIDIVSLICQRDVILLPLLQVSYFQFQGYRAEFNSMLMGNFSFTTAVARTTLPV